MKIGVLEGRPGRVMSGLLAFSRLWVWSRDSPVRGLGDFGGVVEEDGSVRKVGWDGVF